MRSKVSACGRRVGGLRRKQRGLPTLHLSRSSAVVAENRGAVDRVMEILMPLLSTSAGADDF